MAILVYQRIRKKQTKIARLSLAISEACGKALNT